MNDHQYGLHPQYVVRDRQRGKTSMLVEWVKAGSPIETAMAWTRVVIVRDLPRKRFLCDRYHLSGRQVISRREAAQIGSGYDLTLTAFAIDDAEDLILDSFPYGFWNRVKVVTMTGDSTLMEAEHLRSALEDPDAARKRLKELDRLLVDQPDPTMLNAEGWIEKRYAEESKMAQEISTKPAKRTAKKAATKKTGAKRS